MTLSAAFAALYDYFRSETDNTKEVAEVIYDTVMEGAQLLDSTASRLMMDFVAAIPGSDDDIYDTDIVKALETVDTEEAKQVAQELRGIIAQPF